MTGCNSRISCRSLFKKWEILPFESFYILSLMLFVVNNKNLFTLNSDKCNISTRHINNFYQPASNYTVYQKGVYCMGSRVFNNLPPHIKEKSYNLKKFKTFSPYTLLLFRRRILSI
jgi:hypothetical protein